MDALDAKETDWQLIHKKTGFALVELVVVLSIAGVLLAVVAFEFGRYSRKTQIERQTKTLYADIMEQRTRAMYEKRSRGIKLNAASYEIYSSATGSTLNGTPVAIKSLPERITWNNTNTIVFEVPGTILNWSAICPVNTDNPSNFDSLVVSQTRVRMGKINQGAACNESNIKPK